MTYTIHKLTAQKASATIKARFTEAGVTHINPELYTDGDIWRVVDDNSDDDTVLFTAAKPSPAGILYAFACWCETLPNAACAVVIKAW